MHILAPGPYILRSYRSRKEGGVSGTKTVRALRLKQIRWTLGSWGVSVGVLYKDTKVV